MRRETCHRAMDKAHSPLCGLKGLRVSGYLSTQMHLHLIHHIPYISKNLGIPNKLRVPPIGHALCYLRTWAMLSSLRRKCPLTNFLSSSSNATSFLNLSWALTARINNSSPWCSPQVLSLSTLVTFPEQFFSYSLCSLLEIQGDNLLTFHPLMNLIEYLVEIH